MFSRRCRVVPAVQAVLKLKVLFFALEAAVANVTAKGRRQLQTTKALIPLVEVVRAFGKIITKGCMVI